MHTIQELEESIRRMTAAARRRQADEVARSFGEDPDAPARPLGWWVLACGAPLADGSFEQREAAREKLLHSVRMAGLALAENIWVWDDSGQAQLVISTVPSLERAERLADHLRRKGLLIRIKKEKI